MYHGLKSAFFGEAANESCIWNKWFCSYVSESFHFIS